MSMPASRELVSCPLRHVSGRSNPLNYIQSDTVCVMPHCVQGAEIDKLLRGSWTWETTWDQNKPATWLSCWWERPRELNKESRLQIPYRNTQESPQVDEFTSGRELGIIFKTVSYESWLDIRGVHDSQTDNCALSHTQRLWFTVWMEGFSQLMELS